MDEKEELYFEMLNLEFLLLKYLKFPLNEIAYLELNDAIVSMQYALRNYYLKK